SDRNVAEDKITLFAHGRPLSTTLKAVARFFNFTWRRTGEPGSYTYTLFQSAAQRRAEEREIEQRMIHEADRIVRDVELFKRIGNMPKEQQVALADKFDARIAAEQDPKRRLELQEEKKPLVMIPKASPATAIV